MRCLEKSKNKLRFMFFFVSVSLHLHSCKTLQLEIEEIRIHIWSWWYLKLKKRRKVTLMNLTIWLHYRLQWILQQRTLFGVSFNSHQLNEQMMHHNVRWEVKESTSKSNGEKHIVDSMMKTRTHNFLYIQNTCAIDLKREKSQDCCDNLIDMRMHWHVQLLSMVHRM